MNKKLKTKQVHCFYNPCSFITNTELAMEQHYQQKHYFESKEVNHV